MLMLWSRSVLMTSSLVMFFTAAFLIAVLAIWIHAALPPAVSSFHSNEKPPVSASCWIEITRFITDITWSTVWAWHSASVRAQPAPQPTGAEAGHDFQHTGPRPVL